MIDRSNGWEELPDAEIAELERTQIGVAAVEAWARELPDGAAVADVGAGPGGLRTAALVRRGFDLYAIEPSLSLAAAYRRRFPGATVACEPAEDSSFFDRRFDGALAWGVIFLLQPEAQEKVIQNVGRALLPGGRFLFTAPRQACSWPDSWTGRSSFSLGAEAYEAALLRAGLRLVATEIDEGENHYYSAVKV